MVRVNFGGEKILRKAIYRYADGVTALVCIAGKKLKVRRSPGKGNKTYQLV